MKTTIKINKTFTDHGNLKGIASANFDDCFAVTGIRILDSQKGLFVSMPNRKVGNEYKDICFPVTKEFREELNSAVLNAYHQKLEESQEHETENDQKQDGSGAGSKNGGQDQDDGSAAEEESDITPEESEEPEEMTITM